MGCIASKADLGDTPGLFQVWNVDEEGHALAPGQLHVTDHELVLYQRAREPVRWPMRCLRRYGFDAELFSFESGRRCPTGPGIYAFKCRRAEVLFNVLQERIQNSRLQDADQISQMGVPRSSSLSDSGGYLEPRTRSWPTAAHSIPSSLSDTSSHAGPLSPIAPLPSPRYNLDAEPTTPPVQITTHQYVNSTAIDASHPSPPPCPILDLVTVRGCNGCRVPSPRGVNCGGSGDDNYARLDDLLKHEHTQRLYINVKPDTERTPPLRDPYYANIGPDRSKISPSTPTAAQPLPPARQVNYVVLDLDRNSESCASPNSPLSVTSLPESPYRSGAEGYATIDFDKTAALSNSTQFGPDESVRKTRHNSTISDLMLYRNNNAVSD